MAFTLRLPRALDERLRQQADEEGRSLAAVVESAVTEYVDRRSREARLDEALDVLEPRYRELLDRLGK
jgi:predicted transcriptional regulator